MGAFLRLWGHLLGTPKACKGPNSAVLVLLDHCLGPFYYTQNHFLPFVLESGSSCGVNFAHFCRIGPIPRVLRLLAQRRRYLGSQYLFLCGIGPQNVTRSLKTVSSPLAIQHFTFQLARSTQLVFMIGILKISRITKLLYPRCMTPTGGVNTFVHTSRWFLQGMEGVDLVPSSYKNRGRNRNSSQFQWRSQILQQALVGGKAL